VGEWTADDFLAVAHHHGQPVTDRLLVDWTERGFLAQRRRRGTGRGSTAGTWSDGQRHLFELLLNKRPGLTRVTPLANLPVACWLTIDDDTVPTDQVRRAMRTWAGHAAGKQALRLAADDVIADLNIADEARRELRRQLTELFLTVTATKTPASRDIERALRRFLDELVRFHEADHTLTDAYLRTVIARAEGTTPFAAGTDARAFSDDDLTMARSHFRDALHAIAASGSLTEQELFNEILGRACRTLATHLGHITQARQHRPSA